MRLLNREDVTELLSMKEIISLMRRVFRLVQEKGVNMPERTVLNMANNEDAVLFMPCAVHEAGHVGQKTVTVFPQNPASHLPAIQAQIQLIDPHNGKLLCIMDGTLITAMRTAAVSALATDLLANEDANSLGVFGCGVQGETHIRAIMEVRNLDEVTVLDNSPGQAESLIEKTDDLKEKCNIHIAASSEALIRQSDIVVTATTSKVPVFNGTHLLPGTHINAIGSFKPSVREVDDTTISRSRVFVDTLEHALAEAGDLLIPIDRGVLSKHDIIAELGELVTGKKTGRTDKNDITFFKSVGLAAEDIIVAGQIFQKAEQHNLGMIYD
jgi:ornithine cyclodeaminase/alanine dehydrogenase-like protein (mu-crystallin family)